VKVRDIIVIVAAIVIGIAATSSRPTAENDRRCDAMEESRLKMALDECSDAVMQCTWGDDYKEVSGDAGW
jgi:hypothetical protein